MPIEVPAQPSDGPVVRQSPHTRQWVPSRGHAAAAQGLALVCICVVALLVAACGAAATSSGQGTSGAGAAASATLPPAQIPPGWRLYRDPGGYFTVAIPNNWQVAATPPGHGILGGGSYGPLTTVDVETGFVPPEGNPLAAADGLGIEVSYTVYTNSAGHLDQGVACEVYQQSNTTLAGMKAKREHPYSLHIWSIGTSAATYQVSYRLPSTWPYGGMVTTLPTPVPSATFTAVQNLIGTLLATLRLTPATPPTC